MSIDYFSEERGWLGGLRILPNLSSALVAILLASVFINVLSLALPITLIQVYDRILPNEGTSSLAWLVTGVCAALVLEALLRTGRTYLSGWLGIHFETLVGGSAFERLVSTGIAEFERDGLGSHVDRLGAVSVLREFYSGQAFQVLLDIPFGILFLLTIWYLGGILALVPLSAILIFLGLVLMSERRFSKAIAQRTTANDQRYNFIIEVLSGIHTVKALGMEEQMLRRYERLQETTAENNLDVTQWSLAPMAMGSLFSQITMFGVVGLGAKSVIDGGLTIGAMAGCTLLAGRAMQPIQSAAGFWLRFSDVRLARDRLAQIARLQPEVPEGLPPITGEDRGELVMQDVSFQFGPEEPQILKNLNVSISGGEMVGIRGDSASGKSTLLYLMMGALQPTGGSVHLDGHNLAEVSHEGLETRIAYLPQTGILFKGTIMDNITMFRDEIRDRVPDVVKLLGLDTILAETPDGYETVVGKESQATLPGGAQQRIAIARALVNGPNIVLFDEANVAMDAKGDVMLINMLKALKGKRTIVLVTHRPSLLELADQIYDLKGGKLVKGVFQKFGQARPAPPAGPKAPAAAAVPAAKAPPATAVPAAKAPPAAAVPAAKAPPAAAVPAAKAPPAAAVPAAKAPPQPEPARPPQPVPLARIELVKMAVPVGDAPPGSDGKDGHG